MSAVLALLGALLAQYFLWARGWWVLVLLGLAEP